MSLPACQVYRETLGHPRRKQELTRSLWRSYWDNGKENGNYRDYRGYVGIIALLYGCIAIMENKMETTIYSFGFGVQDVDLKLRFRAASRGGVPGRSREKRGFLVHLSSSKHPRLVTTCTRSAYAETEGLEVHVPDLLTRGK